MDATHAIELTPHDGQVFRFDAGALCLEFLLSGALSPWEQLHAPADLAAWLPLTRLGPVGEVAVDEAGLADAKRLRAALLHLAHQAATRNGASKELFEPVGEGGEAAVQVVNGFAAAPPPVPELGDSMQWSWAEPVTCAQFLSAVARDAIELFGGPRAGRVRMCGGERCYLLFLDTSRPGARRWCSMDRCGNRHKLRTRRGR